jgi:hypothetical protein
MLFGSDQHPLEMSTGQEAFHCFHVTVICHRVHCQLMLAFVEALQDVLECHLIHVTVGTFTACLYYLTFLPLLYCDFRF